jgi:hypothetical protein
MGVMKLPLDHVSALLRACAATGEDELTCDELLDVLAAHLERPGAGAASDRQHALAAQHLRLCASCRQESEALAALIREDSTEPARGA